MKRTLSSLTFPPLFALFLFSGLPPAWGASEPAKGAPASTQAPIQLSDLTGTWTLVSVDNLFPDGRRTQPYGPHPEGLLMLDAEGRYSIHIFKPGRAPFAANDKAKGTPEEYREAVQGINTHYGRYAVDAESGVLTFRIEHALFPNWEGTAQRRSFTLVGDELRYTVNTTTTGGREVGEVTWHRAR